MQVELARWTISTGQPALTGYNKVPPHIGGIGCINILWAIMALSKVLQVGGVLGGTAVAFSILMPLGGDPLGATSLAIWTVIIATASIFLLYSNNYSLIERGSILLVGSFTLVTIAIALGLPFTRSPTAWTISSRASPSPSLPAPSARPSPCSASPVSAPTN
ncbi:hypothetical protein [Aureimonas altamirensis]|uniref:hypothetical protein n=1 Tax=Aureimonas altamirensis TaxID=370622 RepID=UPI0025564E60|nr:hypothetical protein [Aureimonas altamirensis]